MKISELYIMPSGMPVVDLVARVTAADQKIHEGTNANGPYSLVGFDVSDGTGSIRCTWFSPTVVPPVGSTVSISARPSQKAGVTGLVGVKMTTRVVASGRNAGQTTTGVAISLADCIAINGVVQGEQQQAQPTQQPPQQQWVQPQQQAPVQPQQQAPVQPQQQAPVQQAPSGRGIPASAVMAAVEVFCGAMTKRGSMDYDASLAAYIGGIANGQIIPGV